MQFLRHRYEVDQEEMEGYRVHAHVRADGLAATATCDAEYPARAAFSLLAQALAEFERASPGWRTGLERDWPPLAEHRRRARDGTPAVEYGSEWDEGSDDGEAGAAPEATTAAAFFAFSSVIDSLAISRASSAARSASFAAFCAASPAICSAFLCILVDVSWCHFSASLMAK